MILQLTTGKCVQVSPSLAARLWYVKNGEIKATPELKEKAEKVRNFFFGPSTAPESWKKVHAKVEDKPQAQAIRTTVPAGRDWWNN
jgi:hypothetical protein